jgi:hypothetical protein
MTPGPSLVTNSTIVLGRSLLVIASAVTDKPVISVKYTLVNKVVGSLDSTIAELDCILDDWLKAEAEMDEKVMDPLSPLLSERDVIDIG